MYVDRPLKLLPCVVHHIFILLGYAVHPTAVEAKVYFSSCLKLRRVMIDTHSSAAPLYVCSTSRYGNSIPFGPAFAVIDASHTYLEWRFACAITKKERKLMHAWLCFRVGEGEVMQKLDSPIPQLQTKPIFREWVSENKCF